ncbi:MAG: ribonuclease Z [Imperialibacter sp.]|uniref:ribonuclease Z n=1 Tax=Imperialibacter sp. TaxID=2038411 RepID=UPI0032EEF758
MSFVLKILGSNSAAPAHNRNQTSQVLVVDDEHFLIDCGEATQLQLKKYKVKATKINHIFISHLHGDHYYGLIGLLSTMHLYGRKARLFLYGPPGLSEILSLQFKYSNTTLNFPIQFKEWMPGTSEVLLENQKIIVSSFPVNHRIACSGFLFREKPKNRRIEKSLLPPNVTPTLIIKLKNGEDLLDEKGNIKYKNSEVTLPPRPSYSYAYCADTKYDESLIQYIGGVDMLYHEGTFLEDMKERAELTFHSTAGQAATLALKAGVGKLILGHFSTRYKELNPLLEEALTVFKESYLGIEGTDFSPA